MENAHSTENNGCVKNTGDVPDPTTSAADPNTAQLSKDWCEVKLKHKPLPLLLPNGMFLTEEATEQLEKLQLVDDVVQSPDEETEVDRPPGGMRQRSPSGSCLKSPARTPPGTPTERKTVRFADDLGRKLVERVKLFRTDSNSDIHVPDYVYETLGILPHDVVPTTTTFLQPLFDQPVADYMGFQCRLRSNNLCLENAVASDLTILGTVKVCNLGFHKSVKIRYTLDEWKSISDKPGTYVKDSCDGPTDRFSFALTAPTDMEIGNCLEFAVCYTVNGEDYWDSNEGENYKLECQPKGRNDQ